MKPKTIPTVLEIDSPRNNKRGTTYTYARGTLCVCWVKGQKSVLIKKYNDSALMTFESCTCGKHSAYSVTFFFHSTKPPAKEENKLPFLIPFCSPSSLTIPAEGTCLSDVAGKSVAMVLPDNEE